MQFACGFAISHLNWAAQDIFKERENVVGFHCVAGTPNMHFLVTEHTGRESDPFYTTSFHYLSKIEKWT